MLFIKILKNMQCFLVINKYNFIFHSTFVVHKNYIYTVPYKTTKIIILAIAFVLLFSTRYVFSQTPPRTTRPLDKYEMMFPQVKYGDNIYQTGSNWFTIAYGYGYHTNKKVDNVSFSMAYHHRYKAMYFRGGFHFAGPEFFLARGLEQLLDFHVGGGLRFEGRYYNFAFFIGPSFASTWIPVENEAYSTIYNQLGAHTEVQITYKYFYDLGIGTSLYGSFNQNYQVIGVQLHLYFSNAFVRVY